MRTVIPVSAQTIPPGPFPIIRYDFRQTSGQQSVPNVNIPFYLAGFFKKNLSNKMYFAEFAFFESANEQKFSGYRKRHTIL